MKAKRNRFGFTLAELLIVIAILAVLIATAIPAYIAQLNKSKERVDDATVRSAESLASAAYQLNNRSGWVCYNFEWDTDGSHSLVIHQAYPADSDADEPVLYSADAKDPCQDAFNNAWNNQSSIDSDEEAMVVRSERYPNTKTLIVRCKDGGVAKGGFLNNASELFPGS